LHNRVGFLVILGESESCRLSANPLDPKNVYFDTPISPFEMIFQMGIFIVFFEFEFFSSNFIVIVQLIFRTASILFELVVSPLSVAIFLCVYGKPTRFPKPRRFTIHA